MDHLTDADRRALERLQQTQPAITGLCRGRDILPGDRRCLLHAGPTFDSSDGVSEPVRSSAVMAALVEGWAADEADAEQQLADGTITLEPAQDHDAVVPLAGVIAPSTALLIVADPQRPQARCLTPINEGTGPALRLGHREPELLQLLPWINGELAETLDRALAEPLPTMSIIARALQQGDDCHGRTIAATSLLHAELARRLSSGAATERALAFIAAAPPFFLNPCMASSRLLLQAAAGVAESTVVTAAGGNGSRFGIQLAGRPGHWITVAATPPRAVLPEDCAEDDACGAIGDSAVVDVFGLGGMALRFAPKQVEQLQAVLPEGWPTRPDELLAIELPEEDGVMIRTGLTGAACVQSGRTPLITLGVLDRHGRRGRIAGGVYEPPVSLFRDAVVALEDARS